MKNLALDGPLRWTARTLTLSLKAGGLILFLAGMAVAQANWAQTNFNGARTSFNPNETTLNRTNVPSLQLRWAAGVAGGVTNFAVAGGVLYVTGQSNNLVALNSSTGAQIWSTRTGGNTGINAIAAGQGRVFAQCDLTDTGGTLYGAVCAFRASTGKPAWRFANPCNCLPEASVQAPLLFANGTVYIGYSNGGVNPVYGLYAVSASSGTLLWDYEVFNCCFDATSMASAGGYVYVFSSENVVYAFQASTGALAWTTPLSANNTAAVSVAGGIVYVSTSWNGTNATLYALNAATGAIRWSYAYGTGNWGGSAEAPWPPAIAQGVVYLQGADHNLYALRANTGALIWSDMVNTDGYGFKTSPSIANGVLYIDGGYPPADPNTSAYDAATGALLWSSPSSHGTLFMPPEVVNGILYFASPGDSICSSICAYSLP